MGDYPTRRDAITRYQIPETCECCDGPLHVGFECRCGPPETRTPKYELWYRKGVLWLECADCGEEGLPIRVANPGPTERIHKAHGRRYRRDEPPPTIPDAFLR